MLTSLGVGIDVCIAEYHTSGIFTKELNQRQRRNEIQLDVGGAMKYNQMSVGQ